MQTTKKYQAVARCAGVSATVPGGENRMCRCSFDVPAEHVRIAAEHREQQADAAEQRDD